MPDTAEHTAAAGWCRCCRRLAYRLERIGPEVVLELELLLRWAWLCRLEHTETGRSPNKVRPAAGSCRTIGIGFGTEAYRVFLAAGRSE